jgi:tellurite resistance protein TerC
MHVTLTVWILTFLLFAAILGWEVFSSLRNPHTPSLRSSAVWSVVYIAAALLFGLVVLQLWGRERAVEYVAGYVTERALSVDNLFVFILIMSAFAVPRRHQQEVMLVGVGIAIVLRAIFIGLGAAIIERFSWVFFIFGIFLLITGWKLATSGGESDDDEFQENGFIRAIRRLVPVTDSYHGSRVWIREHGRILLTPMAIVMLAIGSTDLLFAFDSIPAIFGLTDQAYIVFVANAWALMGMVQLYFLLGGLLERLVYLSYGLAFILGLIGVKLIVHALHENRLPFLNHGEPVHAIPEISTGASLLLIVIAIAVAAWFSLQHTRDLET